MVKVLVHSSHLLTSAALVGLLNALGFAGSTDAVDAELALWDLCSYRGYYPPPAPVATLAMVSAREENMAELLRMGYRGFLKTQEGPEVLKKALQALRRGEIWAERSVIAEALGPKENHQLTLQELRVLNLLTQGLSNRDIALQLGIGEKTVKGYLSKLFDKTGAKNRTDLILQHMKSRG